MILLISEDYFKTQSGLNDNIYGSYLLPTIRESQDIDLQQIIGSELLDTLCAMIEDETILYESNYKILLDKYIQPFLLYATICNLIPFVATKISNIGLVINNDEHVVNVSKNERDYLIWQYNYKKVFYKKKLQKYLCKNKSKFNELNKEQEILPNLIFTEELPIYVGGAKNPTKKYK